MLKQKPIYEIDQTARQFEKEEYREKLLLILTESETLRPVVRPLTVRNASWKRFGGQITKYFFLAKLQKVLGVKLLKFKL